MIGQPANVPAGYMVVRVLVGISGLSVFSRGTNLLAHQTKRSFKNRIHQSGKRARVSCPSSHLGSQQAAECMSYKVSVCEIKDANDGIINRDKLA